MDEKTRASADARFRKALRPAGEVGNPYDVQDPEARSAAALTAKLKAQRLERDAADAASGAAAKRASPVRKAAPRKGVGSY